MLRTVVKYRQFAAYAFLPFALALVLTGGWFKPGVLLAASAPDAKILFFEGDVQVKHSTNDPWRSAERGVSLSAGSQVTTGRGSTCELGIGEGIDSAVKIQSDSQLLLKSLNPVKLYLPAGKIITIVEKLEKGGSFEVEAKTASLSVSTPNTGFSQSQDQIEIYEGRELSFQTASGEVVNAREGQSYRLGPDGSVKKVYGIQENSVYDDFSGQIKDYRWAIPGVQKDLDTDQPKSGGGVSETGQKKEEAQENVEDESAQKSEDKPLNIPDPPPDSEGII